MARSAGYNMAMVRFVTALLLALPLAAQLTTDVFQKAPPVIEKALRARIDEFFQLHVEGKFRQAEALVAEDSKDYFYSSNKPKYLKYRIDRIAWSDNYTKAKATVVCDMYVMVPGFTDKPLPVPTPSNWKLVDGEWYWYVDQEALNATPFGRMKEGGGGGGSGALPPPPTQKDLERILQQVRADKEAVKLDPKAPSTDRVTISNQMPGPVKIVVQAPRVPGLEVTADAETIPANGKSTVTFRYKPGGGEPQTPAAAEIRVEPTGQVFTVQIAFN